MIWDSLGHSRLKVSMEIYLFSIFKTRIWNKLHILWGITLQIWVLATLNLLPSFWAGVGEQLKTFTSTFWTLLALLQLYSNVTKPFHSVVLITELHMYLCGCIHALHNFCRVIFCNLKRQAHRGYIFLMGKNIYGTISYV